MTLVPPAEKLVAADVRRALAEDLADGDRTAALLPAGAQLRARVIVREAAVFCGRPWFEESFQQLEPALAIDWSVRDGDVVAAEQEICRISGPAAALLSAERTALNFIQTLSGTATVTRRYVDQLNGTGTRLLDTRKTIPGLRQAQKYAVRCGGGQNHRMGLFDAYLIKENHIAAAGSISAALASARRAADDLLLEIEVENLQELREAMAGGAERALLDNFSLAMLREAVALAADSIELEASGDITLAGLREVAGTGVDFISTGAITKHMQAIDFSLRFLD